MYYAQAGNMVLIRVPKTGSSSAMNLIKQAHYDSMENGPPHETYAEMRTRIKSDFLEQQSWRVIGFVRHPLPWLNSMVAQFWDDCIHGQRWFGGGFKRFDGPDLCTNILLHAKRTPYDWFTDADGNIRVTEVRRMEDMDEFAASLHLAPLHQNITPDAERRTLNWTTEQLDAIRSRFHRELQHYPEGL